MITNLRNGDRYIGRSRDTQRRFWQHFAPSGVGCNSTLLGIALLEYSKQDFSFEILEEIDNDAELPKREEFWISKLKPEYNRCAGGLGVKGYVPSQETRAKLREYGKKQWATKTDEEKSKIKKNFVGPKIGHEVSAQTREKLRNANLGKKQSEETISKRKASIKAVNSSGRVMNQSHKKTVSSLIDGVVIKTYPSIKDAAIELGCIPSSISSVLKGRKKSCKGFSWKYGV